LATPGWLWSTTVQGLLLLLTGGALLLTHSRVAWVGILVALTAYLGWHNRQTRTVAILAIGALLVAAIVNGPERLIDLAIGQSGPGTSGHASGRVEIWSRAIYAIQDFPLTGMGMNTFRKVMPVFYPALPTSAEIDVAHAHNHLLQAALDLGLPGLVAYLSIWLVVAGLLVDVYRRRVGEYRVLANGLGTGLIAHFSFSMTDAIPLGAKVGILFWLTLALVVSLHRVSLSEAPGQERPRDEPTYSENPA
jgi:putative inorganic carbon (HCO3(-)) transporter